MQARPYLCHQQQCGVRLHRLPKVLANSLHNILAPLSIKRAPAAAIQWDIVGDGCPVRNRGLNKTSVVDKRRRRIRRCVYTDRQRD
jgi:hypothetical protein